MYRGTLENWLFVFFNLFPYGMDLQSNSKIENIKEKFPTTGKNSQLRIWLYIKCNLYFYSSGLEQKWLSSM